MKKIILMALMLVALASPSWATWTFTVRDVNNTNHWIEWKVRCVGDGSAVAATNIMAPSIMSAAQRELISKSMFCYMDIIVGAGSAAPGAAYDITITDQLGVTKYTHTISTYATTTYGYDLAEDSSYPWLCPLALNLAVGDLDANLDEITIVFHCWIE